MLIGMHSRIDTTNIITHTTTSNRIVYNLFEISSMGYFVGMIRLLKGNKHLDIKNR